MCTYNYTVLETVQKLKNNDFRPKLHGRKFSCPLTTSIFNIIWYTLFFYQNIFYKNIEAEICEILRIF